jgi:hypothetical protein
VASRRPFAFAIPSGNVWPRSRAIRFRMGPCACAEGIQETPPLGSPPMESARAPTPNRRADVAKRRRKLIVGLPRTSSVPGLSPAGPEISERGNRSTRIAMRRRR